MIATRRTAWVDPSAARPRRGTLGVVPIAYDSDGRPHGIRLELAEPDARTWLDVPEADAFALIGHIRRWLGPTPKDSGAPPADVSGIAQRIAKIPGFRPEARAGLRLIHPKESGSYRVTDPVGLGHSPVMGSSPMFAFEDGIPDLNDPATEGLIAAWARELCGAASLHVAAIPGRKSSTGGPVWTITNGQTPYVCWAGDRMLSIAVEIRGVAWAIVVLDKLEVGVRPTAADVNEGGGS